MLCAISMFDNDEMIFAIKVVFWIIAICWAGCITVTAIKCHYRWEKLNKTSSLHEKIFIENMKSLMQKLQEIKTALVQNNINSLHADVGKNTEDNKDIAELASLIQQRCR